jgi:hypothetical protein
MTRSILLVLRAALLGFVGSAAVFAQGADVSQDFEKCKVISDDQTRLNCLKKLIPSPHSEAAATTTHESWRLVRTPNPKGGPEAVAVMRMADTAQSDPDLAGLMIRCAETPGPEVLLALVRPVPPRTKTDVIVALGTTQSVLHAQASAAGTALILPIEAATFTTGPWRGLKDLAVTIKHPEAEIRGTIPLDGAASAIAKLLASCPSG